MVDVSGNRGSAIKLHYMRKAIQSVREHQGTQHWDVKKNECDKEKNYFFKGFRSRWLEKPDNGIFSKIWSFSPHRRSR